MNYDAIPDELKQQKQWVVHRAKRPYNPCGGDGKAGQPETWGTFREAVEAAESGGYDGIGFEFNDNGLVGIDLDTVRDPVTGWIAPDALEIIHSVNSYTEISPSGYGFHIIARADIKLQWHKKKLGANEILREDIDLQTNKVRCDENGKPKMKAPEIEMYTGKRYFTITGNVYDNHATISKRTSAIAAVHNKWVLTNGGLEWSACINESRALPPAVRGRNNDMDFIEIGLTRDSALWALWNGERPNKNESADDMALCNKLAYWCNRNIELMEKAFFASPHWNSKDEAHKRKCERDDYMPLTLQKAAKECSETAEAHDRKHQTTALNCAVTVSQGDVEGLFKPIEAFQEQEARWLIQGWLPEGQIAILASDGGIGKTSVSCNIIAAVSSGGTCILDKEGKEMEREPRKVLFLTTEDSISKKLRKKLRLEGANLNNVIAPDPTEDSHNILRDLKFGSSLLTQVIEKYKPALCVFDPIQGYVPPDVNMGARNAMRDCLAPLITLGEETGCTFLIICHSNKRRGASGRDRISDSADIWDIARSVIMAGFADEEGKGIRYLSNEKNNYAQMQETVLFSIGEGGLVEHRGYSKKHDRDFMEERFVPKKPAEPLNERLLGALKKAASPFDVVRFSYASFEEKYGATIYGGAQPKKALDAMKPYMEEAGYSLIVRQLKIDGRNTKGFLIQPVNDPEPRQLSV